MARVINRRKEGIPTNAVYVGRPSKWGNPYYMAHESQRDAVCDAHKTWLDHILARDPDAINRLRAELKGKDLVCWCAPARCHADYLLELANSEPTKD